MRRIIVALGLAAIVATACRDAPPAPRSRTTFTVSASAIADDGVPVVGVRDGNVGAAELRSRLACADTPALDHPLSAMRARGDSALHLTVDVTTSYALLVAVLASAQRAHFARVTLDGIASTEVSLELNVTGGSSRLGLDDAGPDAVLPTVSVTSTTYTVWSRSGLEGTRTAPRGSWPITADPDALRNVLRDIATRHYAGKPRPNTTHRIRFEIDQDVPMRHVLPLFAAALCPPGRTICAEAGVASYAPATMALFPQIVLRPACGHGDLDLDLTR